MNKIYFSLFFLVALLGAKITQARNLENIFFADSITVKGEQLKLNGVAFRKATVFKVKVYGAALYIKEPLRDSEAILTAKSPKILIMKFTRSVSQEKINEAWDKAFDSVQAKYQNEIKKLKSLMPNTQEGDSLEYNFLEGQTDIKFNDKLIGSLPGGEWGKILLATWIGINPPTEELKSGLLGLSE